MGTDSVDDGGHEMPDGDSESDTNAVSRVHTGDLGSVSLQRMKAIMDAARFDDGELTPEQIEVTYRDLLRKVKRGELSFVDRLVRSAIGGQLTRNQWYRLHARPMSYTCPHCGGKARESRSHFEVSPTCWDAEQAALRKERTDDPNSRRVVCTLCVNCACTIFGYRVPAKGYVWGRWIGSYVRLSKQCIHCRLKAKAVRQAAKRREAAKPADRHCEQCCDLFTSKRADAIYCSPYCRVKAHRAKKKEAS